MRRALEVVFLINKGSGISATLVWETPFGVGIRVKTNPPITMFAVHLDTDAQIRHSQLATLTQVLTTHTQTILAGDFNFSRSLSAIETAFLHQLNAIGLTDTCTNLGPTHYSSQAQISSELDA